MKYSTESGDFFQDFNKAGNKRPKDETLVIDFSNGFSEAKISEILEYLKGGDYK
jgi:hypothetical protein